MIKPYAQLAKKGGGGQWRIQKILVGGDLKPKPQKFGCLHQSWEWFFGRNRKFKRFFRPKSGGLQKKKKKKVFTRIETDFAAGFVTFRSVGGDASRNGAELFKIEADFSAKIVTFRLVGGDASPPKSATGGACLNFAYFSMQFCNPGDLKGGHGPP